jgi:hypothetical protein
LAILELCNLDRIEPGSDSRQPVRHRRRLLLPRGMIVLSRADHDWSLNQDAARARVVSVMAGTPANRTPRPSAIVG